MKRAVTCIAGGVAAAALMIGQGAWAMNQPLAEESRESKSPADKLQEAIDDLDAGSLFMNPLGYVAGHTYVNNSMGISMTIPDSFSITAGEIDGELKYLISAVDETTRETFQLVEVDLVAAGEEGITEDQCLEEFKTGMESTGGFSIVSEEQSQAVLGDDTYTMSDMSVEINGLSGNIKNYCRIDGSDAFILSGMSFENGDEGICEIFDSIASVETGIWNGNTYTSPLFGISLDIPENFSITKDSSFEEGVVYPVAAIDDETGTSLQVVLMDFNQMDGGVSAYEDFDAEDILQYFNEGVEESTGVSMKDGTVSETQVGGETFTQIKVSGDTNDMGVGELRSYGRIEDDYAMVIFTVEAQGDAGVIDDMIGSVLPANVGILDEESHTYMNPYLQMSITFPENWSVVSGYSEESSWDNAFQVGDYETGENIILQVYDLEELGEEDLTEEEYADVVRAQLADDEERTVEDGLNQVMVDGIPYSMLTVTGESGGTAVEQKICYHIVDHILYVFYLTAQPGNYSDGYESVLASMGYEE